MFKIVKAKQYPWSLLGDTEISTLEVSNNSSSRRHSNPGSVSQYANFPQVFNGHQRIGQFAISILSRKHIGRALNITI